MRNKFRNVKVIITKSICPYTPLNIVCNATVDTNELLYSAHRVSDGAGTFFTKSQAKRIEYTIIED